MLAKAPNRFDSLRSLTTLGTIERLERCAFGWNVYSNFNLHPSSLSGLMFTKGYSLSSFGKVGMADGDELASGLDGIFIGFGFVLGDTEAGDGQCAEPGEEADVTTEGSVGAGTGGVAELIGGVPTALLEVGFGFFFGRGDPVHQEQCST